MEIKKKKPQTSIYDQMQTHFVDQDGKVIVEAVDLGMLYLTFLSEIHQCKEILVESKHPDKGMMIDDFYLSLVSESMHKDALKNNRDTINAQIASMEGIAGEAISNHVRKSVFTTFSDILDNKLFNYPTCNVLIRILFIESVMRIMQAYVFMDEAIKENDESKVMLSYANFHCVNHALAYIAFACNVDLKNYVSMSYQTELYAHESSKSIVDKIKLFTG